MPHVPVIIDIIESVEQVDGYHETISENIANNMYEGKQLEEANNLLSTGWLDTFKAECDTRVSALEEFLGI